MNYWDLVAIVLLFYGGKELMEIKSIKIKNIKPYENNPRKNDDAVEAVARSIKEFGFKVPIILDENNVIVAGHTRYKAAKELEMTEVPCVIASDLTPEQIKAFRLADNQSLNFRTAAKEIGMQIRQCLIWNKNTFAMGRQDYQWKHEPCLYGWKEGAAHYFIDDRTQTTVIDAEPLDFKKMKKEELVELLENIYAETKTTVINEKKPARSELHPTMKPIPLIAGQIKNSTKPKEKVLDLFGGSGTTLMACEQMNRQCFTMEYDPRYADVIIERWETYTGQKAELINGNQGAN